jgi:predicted amino acid racemase
MVYVSEISHCLGNQAIALGGGIYRRARVKRALVGCGSGSLMNLSVRPLDAAAIDYYVALDVPEGASVRAGDTVIWASRTQAFVTRAYVAVAADIQSGRPRLLGIFDPWGNEVTTLNGSLLHHLPEDGAHI